MGRHTKLQLLEGDGAPEDDRHQRRNWVKLLVAVPLLPVVALVLAIGVVTYAFATSQISLNFAGPQTGQGTPQADSQDTVSQPLKKRNQDRASRAARTGAVVAFRVAQRLPTGFRGTATITNRGTKPINGWLLGFKIPNAQVLSAVNVAVVKTGKVAWVKNLATAPVLRPGQSVRVVFTAQGPVGKPSVCKFNKVACTLA